MHTQKTTTWLAYYNHKTPHKNSTLKNINKNTHTKTTCTQTITYVIKTNFFNYIINYLHMQKHIQRIQTNHPQIYINKTHIVFPSIEIKHFELK